MKKQSDSDSEHLSHDVSRDPMTHSFSQNMAFVNPRRIDEEENRLFLSNNSSLHLDYDQMFGSPRQSPSSSSSSSYRCSSSEDDDEDYLHQNATRFKLKSKQKKKKISHKNIKSKEKPSKVLKPRKYCSCYYTSCTTKHCSCFGNHKKCVKKCKCENCQNKYNDPSLRKAIETNSNRSAPKKKNSEIQLPEVLHCKCYVTACTKKYCVCFKAKIKCSELCKCLKCKNQMDEQSIKRMK